MELNKIPPRILSAVRQREHKDDAIVAMSPKELFTEYCEWHGLIRWGQTLWNSVHELQPVVVPDDFLTHRTSWRDAMTFARDHDHANKEYWDHELKAYDRAYTELRMHTELAALNAVAAPPVPDGWAHVRELRSALDAMQRSFDDDELRPRCVELVEMIDRVLLEQPAVGYVPAAAIAPAPAPKVVVWLEDGVVQGAVADQSVDVAVIQYGDSDGDQFMVSQADGSDAVATGAVFKAEIDQSRAVELFDAVEDPRPAAGMRP